jgi:hypothetical protein
MNRITIITGALLVLGASGALGQRSTEMFIPIGQSPGLSGKTTVIGTINEIKAQEQILTCTYGAGTISTRITPKTRIWLDRSKSKLQNLAGAFKDCTKGRLVEVKFINNNKRDGGDADWVKVETP